MAYLDSGYVFLGSKGGDSQLIKLHAEPLPAHSTNPGAAGAAAAEDGNAEAGTSAAGAGAGGSSAAAAVDDGPNHVEVVDSWPSLAPIVDFVVMDLERQGQGQVRAWGYQMAVHQQAMIHSPCKTLRSTQMTSLPL